jgi:hypothetical protein
VSVEYIRQKPDEEARADARERVAAAARNGRVPSLEFEPDDLRWAFEGCEHELEELDKLAAEHVAARAERRSAVSGREIRAETERVLREWDEAARVERFAKAQAEARRRLGL